MSENHEKEKSYWDEWAEEGRKWAYVFDGSNYWTARMRDGTENGEPVFDLKAKLEEVEYSVPAIGPGLHHINNSGKWYKEVSNG